MVGTDTLNENFSFIAVYSFTVATYSPFNAWAWRFKINNTLKITHIQLAFGDLQR